MTKIRHWAAAAAVLVGAASAGAATITNPWSGVAGDRAAYSAFALKATGGNYPASVAPAGSLDAAQAYTLDSLTLTRPANDTTGNNPSVGTNVGQLSSLSAPVWVDVYASRTGAQAYSGYVGSSSSSVVWDDGVDPIAPGESFTFNFSGVTLDKNATYWMVFSEDAVEGEISSFRSRVNTSGDDLTPGPGKGYLVGNAVQLEGPTGNALDWGVEYTAAVTPVSQVPEPTGLAALALGGIGLLARRRA